MPHITVKPFETALLKKGQYGKENPTQVLYKATDLFSEDELISVEQES